MGNGPNNAVQEPGDTLGLHVRGTLASNESPTDLAFRLVCFVGVDSCTERSTGISSTGVHSTRATASTPSTIHPAALAGRPTSAGKHCLVRSALDWTLDWRCRVDKPYLSQR